MSEASRVGQRRRHAAADEDPQRLLDVEGPERRSLLAVEPLLLEEGQQAGDEVQLQVVLLRVLVEVQDLVVLAESVAVEIAVRVVEEDALGVEVGERLACPSPPARTWPSTRTRSPSRTARCESASTRLPRRRWRRGGLRRPAPGCCPRRRRRRRSCRPSPRVSLCDVEDLDRLPGEQPAPVLVEQLGRRCPPSRTRAGAAG